VAALPQSFEAAVELFAAQREMMLYTQLQSQAHLVAFEPGRIEINPADDAPQNLANRVGALLTEWTGTRWVVSISSESGAPTLRQQAAAADAALREEAAQHPVVQAVLENFPGAEITAVRDLAADAATTDEPPADGPEDGDEETET
jgi:DNA polymerase-3 subunit gamma/tau